MSALRNVLDLQSTISLPADPYEAADAVVALIERSTIDLSGHDDALVKCDGRFFLIVWGAGLGLVEVSSFAGQYNPLIEAYYAQRVPANDWPVDAGDFNPGINDALSIEFYMDAARLQATGMAPRVRPGVGVGLRRLAVGACLVIWLALAITIVGALAGDGMERCQQTASFDTCFTALNR